MYICWTYGQIKGVPPCVGNLCMRVFLCVCACECVLVRTCVTHTHVHTHTHTVICMQEVQGQEQAEDAETCPVTPRNKDGEVAALEEKIKFVANGGRLAPSLLEKYKPKNRGKVMNEDKKVDDEEDEEDVKT